MTDGNAPEFITLARTVLLPSLAALAAARSAQPLCMQASELILNSDGSIYHLNLLPEQIAPTIITVGDPDRVPLVSRYFDRIEVRVQRREFHTHTGELNGRRLSVISTGIGTDNVDIVLNELDALFNVDFAERRVRNELQRLDLIRIGTTGSMQAHIDVDEFLASAWAIGSDGLLPYYQRPEDLPQRSVALRQSLLDYLKQHEFSLPNTPYVAPGSETLLDRLDDQFHRGITVTCPGFYGPQGRQLRLPTVRRDLPELLRDFQFDGLHCTNFEMETAGIYGLGTLLGHRVLSCNAVLANRITKRFSTQPDRTIDRLIRTVLERLQ